MVRLAGSKGRVRGLLALAFVVLSVTAVHAQSITDPQRVEFTPSADHNAVDASGTPIVTNYSLQIYTAGSSTIVQTVLLGKPAPEADGMIRVNFVSLLSSPLATGVV